MYLWVDGNDPEWRRKRNAVIGVTHEDSGVNCKGRYADNEELKFSLRSVELYAPWIRKIFIVTDNQTPAWLDTSHPKIQIVDHRELLPEEMLPTFNSNVVEHVLHRIPGLSERFLYSNDDMFFNRETRPSDFFTAEGLPIVRLNRRPMRKLALWLKEKFTGKPVSYYNHIIQNASDLVEKRYGRSFGVKPHHNIDAFLKSDYAHTYELFREEIEPTLKNHVRSDNDIQRIIYTFVPMIEKRCKPVIVTGSTSYRMHIEHPEHYKDMERRNPLLFCVNDSEFATDGHRLIMHDYLMSRFPTKSSFEKS